MGNIDGVKSTFNVNFKTAFVSLSHKPVYMLCRDNISVTQLTALKDNADEYYLNVKIEYITVASNLGS
jgi:hypothetical protein